MNKGKSGARRDAVIVICVMAIVTVVVLRFNALEAYYKWSRDHQNWQADEIISLLVVLAIATTVFSIRRSHEVRREIGGNRELEERFEAVFANAGMGIGLVAPDGRILQCNPALHRILGYDKEELKGKKFTNMTHPQDVRRDASLARELFEGKRNSYQVEKRYTRRDGATVWARLTVSLVHDELGKPTYAIGMVEDITEQKMLEEAIGESVERLETVVETVEAGITLSNISGRFEVYNSKMQEITGYSMEEANAAEDFTALLYPKPSDHQKALDGLKAILENGGSRNIETLIRTKHGAEKTLLVSTTLISRDRGDLFLSSYHDITERKHAEEALRRSELWLGTIFEASRDGIVVEYDDKIVYANRAFAEIYGHQPKALLGQHLSIVQSPHDNERMLEFARKRMKGDEAPSIYEFKGKRKDGSIIDLEASVSTSSIDGKRYIVSAIRDIADRKQAEQERENLILELQEALANVRTLSGLLPICSSCKNIRDDEGYWHKVESYMKRHSGITFTHGICPVCAEKLYPGLLKKKHPTANEQ